MRRVRAVGVVAIAAALTGTGCGLGGDDGGSPQDRAAAKPVGDEVAGSVVQYADCGDWRRGSPAERVVTIEHLRQQLTPQRSATAGSPLSDERAYAMIDKACTPAYASLRLYKLYVRMQGFAPLSR